MARVSASEMIEAYVNKNYVPSVRHEVFNRLIDAATGTTQATEHDEAVLAEIFPTWQRSQDWLASRTTAEINRLAREQ